MGGIWGGHGGWRDRGEHIIHRVHKVHRVHRVHRPNSKKNMVYGTLCRSWLYNLTLYVHSRVDSNTFTTGNLMQLTITSHYVHPRVGSNTFTMSIEKSYARDDLNLMPESTWSPQSRTLDLASEHWALSSRVQRLWCLFWEKERGSREYRCTKWFSGTIVKYFFSQYFRVVTHEFVLKSK